MTVIYIDGQWYTRDTAKVSVFDHGLLYGDGVFEGMRVYGGKTFKLAEHVDRLYDSAKAIMLEVPISKQEMLAATEEGVRRSGLKEAYLRHVVTRGVGDLGLDPRKCPTASVIIIFDTHQESLSPRVKSLNYLCHILAKVEATVANADEVIMLDAAGHVAEASGMNLFVVKQDLLYTPAVYSGILKGVTRDVVIEIASEAGHRVVETVLNRYDIYTADEAFFTGTAAEIAPIRSLDGRIIGSGKAGPVTRDLTARFRQYTRA